MPVKLFPFLSTSALGGKVNVTKSFISIVPPTVETNLYGKFCFIKLTCVNVFSFDLVKIVLLPLKYPALFTLITIFPLCATFSALKYPKSSVINDAPLMITSACPTAIFSSLVINPLTPEIVVSSVIVMSVSFLHDTVLKRLRIVARITI